MNIKTKYLEEGDIWIAAFGDKSAIGKTEADAIQAIKDMQAPLLCDVVGLPKDSYEQFLKTNTQYNNK